MRYPSIIKPTSRALELFGISDVPYELDLPTGLYLFKEDSGIIRQGITIDFYIRFKEFFYITEYRNIN